MLGLFRQGAFAGSDADQAFKVQCDSTTTTPADVANGIVNIVVGFAPLQVRRSSSSSRSPSSPARARARRATMGKPFTVNINRYDPYKTYRFLVYFGTNTTPVAAVSKVGALKRSSDVIEYKEGGNAIILKGLGRTKYEPITLERGVTHDTDFEEWANAPQVLDKGAASHVAGKPAQGAHASCSSTRRRSRCTRYFVHRCWVSEFQALPDLDAGANAIAIEHIKLENEGWERDLSLGEPLEL